MIGAGYLRAKSRFASLLQVVAGKWRSLGYADSEMRVETPGSSGLWVKSSEAPENPILDLHVNLWRHIDRESNQQNLLEYGILITEKAQLTAFYLFIPINVRPESIYDLGTVLRNDTSLSTVFNLVLRYQEVNPTSFIAVHGAATFLHIHHIDPTIDIRFETIGAGTLLSFSPAFLRKFRD